MPLGRAPYSQDLTLVTKRDGRFQTSVLAEVAFVRTTGEAEGRAGQTPYARRAFGKETKRSSNSIRTQEPDKFPISYCCPAAALKTRPRKGLPGMEPTVVVPVVGIGHRRSVYK